MMCNLLSPDVTSRVAGHSVIYRQRQRISFEDSRKIIVVSSSGGNPSIPWVHFIRPADVIPRVAPTTPDHAAAYSQRALAKLVKLDQSTIAQSKRGDRLPSAGCLKRLTNFLRAETED